MIVANLSSYRFPPHSAQLRNLMLFWHISHPSVSLSFFPFHHQSCPQSIIFSSTALQHYSRSNYVCLSWLPMLLSSAYAEGFCVRHSAVCLLPSIFYCLLSYPSSASFTPSFAFSLLPFIFWHSFCCCCFCFCFCFCCGCRRRCRRCRSYNTSR